MDGQRDASALLIAPEACHLEGRIERERVEQPAVAQRGVHPLVRRRCTRHIRHHAGRGTGAHRAQAVEADTVEQDFFIDLGDTP